MANTSSQFPFNLEDKLEWEEWAPSLQDKLKSLINRWHAGQAYIDHFVGSTRITIGDNPPSNPIPYCEIWWDTRYEIFKVLTDEGWIMTHATWYNGANALITDDVDSPISRNPRTRCHCYIISWDAAGYCHCKSEVFAAPSVAQGTQSDMAFNKTIDSPVIAKEYRWVISPSRDGVIITSLNVSTEGSPNTNAILPLEGNTANRVETESGKTADYVTYDEKYSAMFSEDTNGTVTFNTGTTYIPFTFGLPNKLTRVYCTLAPYSSGPVKIALQYRKGGATWVTLLEITLKGNYQPGMACHSNCHCNRW